MTLSLFLQVLAEHCGAKLLRLKGLVDVVESPGRPALIHGVQHVFHPPAWLDAWPDDDRTHAHRRHRAGPRRGLAAGPDRSSGRRGDSMFDLVIRGERVVTPQGVEPREIAVKDGVIAALGAPGTFAAAQAARVIDAGTRGRDARRHRSARALRLVHPADASRRSAGDQRLAGAGQPRRALRRHHHADRLRRLQAGSRRRRILEPERARRARGARPGLGRQVLLRLRLSRHAARQVPPATIAELNEAVQAGYPTIKIFTTDITPSRAGRMIRFGDIWEIFKVLAREGGLAVIHAEDDDIVMYLYEKLIREGRTGFEHMAEVHNTLSEDLSFRRIIRLAEQSRAGALHGPRQRRQRRAGHRREPRRAASRSTARRCTSTLLHQRRLQAAERPDVPHLPVAQVGATTSGASGTGMANGTISHCVATDEVCSTLAVKMQGSKIDDTTGGNAGVEPRVAIIYTETRRRSAAISLERFVDLISTNAAKYPRAVPPQGRHRRGQRRRHRACSIPASDARVRAQDLHEADYTPWEGKEVGAWPSLTVLRGKVMVADGKFHGDLKDGRYLKRRIPPGDSRNGGDDEGRVVPQVRRSRSPGPRGSAEADAKPGEALVRVRAVGINHVDLDHRAGHLAHSGDVPHILGREFAGEVAGSAGHFKEGDRVWVTCRMPCRTVRALPPRPRQPVRKGRLLRPRHPGRLRRVRRGADRQPERPALACALRGRGRGADRLRHRVARAHQPRRPAGGSDGADPGGRLGHRQRRGPGGEARRRRDDHRHREQRQEARAGQSAGRDPPDQLQPREIRRQGDGRLPAAAASTW